MLQASFAPAFASHNSTTHQNYTRHNNLITTKTSPPAFTASSLSMLSSAGMAQVAMNNKSSAVSFGNSDAEKNERLEKAVTLILNVNNYKVFSKEFNILTGFASNNRQALYTMMDNLDSAKTPAEVSRAVETFAKESTLNEALAQNLINALKGYPEDHKNNDDIFGRTLLLAAFAETVEPTFLVKFLHK